MPKKIPMRTCVGCGMKKEKQQLIRVIRTPAGEIAIDANGRGQGRGVYLCPNPSCLEKARKRHALANSLHTEIPPAIYDQLQEELCRMAQTDRVSS